MTTWIPNDDGDKIMRQEEDNGRQIWWAKSDDTEWNGGRQWRNWLNVTAKDGHWQNLTATAVTKCQTYKDDSWWNELEWQARWVKTNYCCHKMPNYKIFGNCSRLCAANNWPLQLQLTEWMERRIVIYCGWQRWRDSSPALTAPASVSTCSIVWISFFQQREGEQLLLLWRQKLTEEPTMPKWNTVMARPVNRRIIFFLRWQ